MTLADIEADVIIERILQHKGNLTVVAKTLDISRAGLYKKINRHKIDLKQIRMDLNDEN